MKTQRNHDAVILRENIPVGIMSDPYLGVPFSLFTGKDPQAHEILESEFFPAIFPVNERF